MKENSLKKVTRVENLHKRFTLKKKKLFVCAVNGVSFSIAKGETLGLVGESGCGKTTIGRCITRLIKPTEGKIIFKGIDIVNLPEEKVSKMRSKIQIVFQEPYDSLNPRKVVRQILENPLIVERRLDANKRKKRINEVLEMVELSDRLLDRYPIELTQGEQQRVGIARALITRPSLVVLDEPTSALDIHFRAEIIKLLRRIQEEEGTAYLFITHDLVAVFQLSHRIAVMYLGRIIEEGSVKEVFKSPVHPYTKALLAAALFPNPEIKRKALLLKGEVPSPVNLPDNRCNLAPRCPLATNGCYESLPQLVEIKDSHFVACFKAS